LLIEYDIPYKIKDHPLTHGRLNLDGGEKQYPCELPADLIYSNHTIAIGVASTALCTFPGLKISIIEMLEKMNIQDMNKRKEYINKLQNEILMPKNFDELSAIIIEIKK